MARVGPRDPHRDEKGGGWISAQERGIPGMYCRPLYYYQKLYAICCLFRSKFWWSPAPEQ
mgnify:CR=1 FL=1